jgi:hypothetical protein
MIIVNGKHMHEFLRRIVKLFRKSDDHKERQLELVCITRESNELSQKRLELMAFIDMVLDDKENDITEETANRLKADYNLLSDQYVDKCRFIVRHVSGTFHPMAWMSNLTPFGWKKSCDQLHKMDWSVYRIHETCDFFGQTRASYGKLVATDGESVIPFEIFKESFPWFVNGNERPKLSPIWTN